MIEAVIFDFDGVLADTEPVYLEYKKEFLKNRGGLNRQSLIWKHILRRKSGEN